MSTIFFRGVVVDVLNSTSDASITNDSRAQSKLNVTSDAMKNFPRNTLIVKTISEGVGKKSGAPIVCYPFFSSHLCMPVKPGEYVWFIYENPEQKGSIAYWLSRVSEPDHVEDANYTFSARTFFQLPDKQLKRTSDKFDGPAVEPGETQTFSWTSPTSDPQELINLIGLATKVHRFESVPRYTKRPGDLVLQGSNNSLIVLGEERGHWASNQHCISSANDPADGIDVGHPAIDIVVGRGSKSFSNSSRGSFGATKGKSITNELGIVELDKREKSDIEGDAHFKVDASRIYLTANSENINKSYHPDLLLGSILPESPHRLIPTLNESGAFAVVKSDNLRLVSRDTGSIRIIKEATDGKTNGSAIMMYNDGEVHVAGQRITLATYETSGATEPYIRQSALISFLNSLLNDLSTLCGQINSAGATLSTAGGAFTTAGGALAAFPPTIPAGAATTTAGTATSSAGATLTAAASTALTSISTKVSLLATNQVIVNGQPAPLGSTVIYGE